MKRCIWLDQFCVCAKLGKVFSFSPTGFYIEGTSQQTFHASSATGDKIYDVDMNNSERVAENERPIALFQSIDAALCDSRGVYVVKGSHLYHFESLMLMVAGRSLPEQRRVSVDMFGCDH